MRRAASTVPWRGATNIIRVDGDGRWSSPFETAARVVKEAGGEASRLASLLAEYDASVAVQAAAICRASGVPEASALKRAMEGQRRRSGLGM